MLVADMFNSKASSPKSRPEEVIGALGLRQGDAVADIGSGGGYFTLRFAKKVGPLGKVYAVDTDPELLGAVEKKAAGEGLLNVTAVLSRADGFAVPEESLDLIFMRNVTHHLERRTEYFSRLRGLLRSGGRVAIIEYRPGGKLSFRGMFGHHVMKETIIEEMEDAGYRLLESLDMLPEQSFTIYVRSSEMEHRHC